MKNLLIYTLTIMSLNSFALNAYEDVGTAGIDYDIDDIRSGVLVELKSLKVRTNFLCRDGKLEPADVLGTENLIGLDDSWGKTYLPYFYSNNNKQIYDEENRSIENVIFGTFDKDINIDNEEVFEDYHRKRCSDPSYDGMYLYTFSKDFNISLTDNYSVFAQYISSSKCNSWSGSSYNRIKVMIVNNLEGKVIHTSEIKDKNAESPCISGKSILQGIGGMIVSPLVIPAALLGILPYDRH